MFQQHKSLLFTDSFCKDKIKIRQTILFWTKSIPKLQKSNVSHSGTAFVQKNPT